MVLARSNDACLEGFSPESRLRFLYADVSETAFALQIQHGLSLPAAIILGKTLAGLALVGIELSDQNEIISINIETDGPVDGIYAELTGQGALRGYTYTKNVPPSPADVDGSSRFGSGARVKLTRLHESGELRSQTSFNVTSATEQNVFMEIYNTTLQLPTHICIQATTIGERVECIRALAVQRIQDSRESEFKRISKLFKDGTIEEQLEIDASVNTLREIFDLPDLTTGPTRTLKLQCTCSHAVATESFKSRSEAEREGILKSRRPYIFRCHLCGKAYIVDTDA